MRLSVMLLPPLVTLALFAGCERTGTVAPGDAAEPAMTAASLGPQTVLPVADYLAEPRYATASGALGARLLQQCRACHTFGAGGPHMVGPNLYDLFGRDAGSGAGYGYSAALGDADFAWTPVALDAWLARPGQFLPGNNMVFPGVAVEEDRNALIAELLRETTNEPAR